jgi:hypothetical protein
MHFDRGRMGSKVAIAFGETTPSLVNLLKGNPACGAREDDVHRYFGIDQYVRLIDSAPHLCINTYGTRKNRFPVRDTRRDAHGSKLSAFVNTVRRLFGPESSGKRIRELQELGEVQVGLATTPRGVAKAVSQLLWPDKDREEWFSLGENHEKVRGLPGFPAARH